MYVSLTLRFVHIPCSLLCIYRFFSFYSFHSVLLTQKLEETRSHLTEKSEELSGIKASMEAIDNDVKQVKKSASGLQKAIGQFGGPIIHSLKFLLFT